MGPFLREFFPDVYRRMHGDVRVSNYCRFDSQLLTLFTSSLYIAGLLTAVLLSSWFTARRGRRPSMIVGGVAFLAGAAVSGGAVNVYMAILGTRQGPARRRSWLRQSGQNKCLRFFFLKNFVKRNQLEFK